VLIAQVYGTVCRYAEHGNPAAEALVELAGITTEPEILSEVAATFTGLDPNTHRYRARGLELLYAAGADEEQVQRIIAERAARRRGFDLGRFAEQA
jgi:hypothetical protein